MTWWSLRMTSGRADRERKPSREQQEDDLGRDWPIHKQIQEGAEESQHERQQRREREKERQERERQE